MRYYNQATGEVKFLPESPKRPKQEDGRELMKQPPVKRKQKSTSFTDMFPQMKMFKLGKPNFQNLNPEYIIENLEFDDILIIGLIALLISDWTEDDTILVLALIFLLISEWIFEPEQTNKSIA